MSLVSNHLVECKNDVVRLVSDDELFLHQNNRAQEQFAHYMGEKAVPAGSISNFNENIDFNVSYAKDKKIKYCHVVFPAKPIVYKDKLKKHGVNVESIFKEKYTKENVIYPIECLSDDSCMEKYGTHYSGKGYFNIVKHLLYSIDEPFEYKPVYIKKTIKNSGLAKMYGGDLPSHEQLVFDSIAELSTAIITLSNATSLTGNSGKIIFKYNPLAPRKKRVLLFGDSFFVGLLNIMAILYEEVIFIRSPYILKDVSNALMPDIVFTGNAERYLVNTPSCMTGSPFFLNFINPTYNPNNLSTDFVSVISFLLRNEKEKYKSWKRKAFISLLNNNGDGGVLRDGSVFELSNIHRGDLRELIRLAYQANLFQFVISAERRVSDESEIDYFLLSKSYNRISCVDQAIVELKKISVKKYTHYEFLGDLFFKNGDIGLAIECYNSAIDLNSSIYNAYLKLGVLYGFLDDKEREKEYFLLAYQKEPNREVTKKNVLPYL